MDTRQGMRALVAMLLVAGLAAACSPFEGTAEVSNAPPLSATGRAGIGLGRVWVTVWNPPRLVGIDPNTGRIVARIAVDPQPLGVQFAGGSLWVGSAEGEGHIVRIDPTTGAVVARIVTVSDWSWLQS